MNTLFLEEPKGPRRSVLQRASSLIPRIRPTKAARTQLRGLLDGHLVSEFEGDIEIIDLERKTLGLEGAIRSAGYLEDQQNKVVALTEARDIEYRSAVEQKDVNAIARFWARTEELKEMYPGDSNLNELVEEERANYRRQRRNRVIK